MLGFVLSALLMGQQLPPLQFEAPPQLGPVRERLESIDPARFEGIVDLIGTASDNKPIQVILAEEGSPWTRAVAPWVAGFAVNSSGTIVIFPTRTPVYPHANLEDVLRHEVAHVLIDRAARDSYIPRWFHEGLAMAAERRSWLGDQSRLLYQLTVGPETTPGELDRQFAGAEHEQQRAYVLAGAFVRDLLQQSGRRAPREILEHVAQGETFDSSFSSVIGKPPDAMALEFWKRQRVWTSWLPVVFSVESLWLAITVLAILTFRKRRRRNAEIERRWAEEDDEGAGKDRSE